MIIEDISAVHTKRENILIIIVTEQIALHHTMHFCRPLISLRYFITSFILIIVIIILVPRPEFLQTR